MSDSRFKDGVFVGFDPLKRLGLATKPASEDPKRHGWMPMYLHPELGAVVYELDGCKLVKQGDTWIGQNRYGVQYRYQMDLAKLTADILADELRPEEIEVANAA